MTEIMLVKPFEQPRMVEAIASIYRQSFGGEPWNEGYVCPVCSAIYALSCDIKICVNCAGDSKNVLLVECWPLQKVVTDFYTEMSKSDPVCIVAQADKNVIGFAWGYRVSANPDLDMHMEAHDLHHSLEGDYFYLDECALSPKHQGCGIGKLLVRHIIREQSHVEVLLRTMNNSRMCSLIKNMEGEIIQHVSRGRVIMKLLRV